LWETSRALSTTILAQLVSDNFGALENDTAAASNIGIADRACGVDVILGG